MSSNAVSNRGPAGPAGNANVLVSPYSSRPAAGNSGALFYPTDGPVSFVDSGAEWKPVLADAGLGVQPPAIGNWSQQMGAGSATDSAGTLLCNFASNGSAHGIKGITYPLPAASNYEIVAGVQVAMYPGQNNIDFAPVGCGWTDGVSNASTWVLAELVQYNATLYQSQEYYVGAAGAPQAISSISNPYSLLLTFGSTVFWRLVDDGTNRYVYFGGNRYDWTLVYQAARTSIISPTRFALGCNPYARTASARLVSYEASVVIPP